jgi:hypothetical protein
MDSAVVTVSAAGDRVVLDLAFGIDLNSKRIRC